MRAAVLRNVGDENVEVLDDVTVGDPGPGQVKIKIHATGVCHSDLSAMTGTIPQPVPAVLGHEGAGEISAVGEGVKSVKVGDHVIVAWMPPCGLCKYCLMGKGNLCIQVYLNVAAAMNFQSSSGPLFGFSGVGTFAEEIIVPAEAAIAIPDDVPYEVASLIGCGVMTGVGAAIKTAQITPGSSVVVFGCGGVGIAAIQGARIAGAAEIVAVDLVDSKLEDAKRFGATHAVKPDKLGEVAYQITGPDGFDYALECIGSAKTIRAAYDAVRRGGTAVVVGVGPADQMIEFNAFELFFAEKTLKGSMYGSGDVRTDFHRLLRLWRAGRLDLEGMITRRMDIGDINEAFAALRRGDVIRQVITF
ncbi:MAG TPA: Zn-dependent alcohol dehydrogenase [Acidimicrobiales bacterium]|nr:Zn-dependent alcohol dehydrogenase [Acidimicrobiales bacterium]